MNKTKYVMANAGMRNSAGEAISVIAESLMVAGIVFAFCGQKCFKDSLSLSVFSSISFTAAIFAVGILLVYITKSLSESRLGFLSFL